MYKQPTEATGANPEAHLGYSQPILAAIIKLMPEGAVPHQRRAYYWLKLTHRDGGRPKYLTMAEGQAIHLTMAETCAADCDCYHRGYEDGQREGAAWGYEDGLREGAEQGNLGALA